MKLKSIVILLSLVTTMMAFNAAGDSDAAFATTNTATEPIHPGVLLTIPINVPFVICE